MKKLFTAIFILLCSVVFGQNGTPLYPITQNIGSTSALLDIKGGARVGGAFVLGHYADTTAANAVPYVKNFANGLITTDTNLLWIRSYNAQRWYFVPNTGNPATGDTLYWRVGGNALIPMQQQGIYTGLGSKDSTPLFFITNYQRRLVIPPNGVNRSAGTANKCLVIDTVTKFMYYTDCGSGGGTTYTFTNGLTESGGTVKLGGTLVDATTTIDGGDAATLSFVDLSQLDINGRYSSFVFDSININSNNIKIDTLNYTLSTTGKKIMLRDTATGLVQNIDASLLTGSTPTLQQVLTAGSTLTTNNTIDADGNTFNIDNTPRFRILDDNSSTERLFIAQTGASVSAPTRYTTKLSSGIKSDVQRYLMLSPDSTVLTGIPYTLSTTGKKIMLRDTATGLVQNIDPLLLAQEAANFADTTNFKPVVINTTGTAGTIGKIYKATYWPGGGGGGWGTTGTVATLTGASTLSMGTNNFTFASTGDANLMKIDAVNDRINISNSGIALGVLTVGGNTWINGSYLAVNDGSNQSTLGSTYLSLYNSFGTPEIRNASGHFQISPIAGYSTVINDNGVDADFRVEGDNDANLIFADAGNDKVGIGTASPTTKLHVAGRFAATQGADVASAAGAITLGTDGNTFEITGTAAITLISNAGWVNGSEINLIFTSTATLTDGTANSGTDIGMELAGNANFTATADDIVTLVLCEIGGVQRWREKSRSVN